MLIRQKGNTINPNPPKVSINPDLCTQCGSCTQACPVEVFSQKEPGTQPEIVNEHFCFSCGQCAAACPTGAIVHTNFPEGSMKPIRDDLLPSEHQVLELIKARRSVRAFEDRPVESQAIKSIIEAARFAPTARNRQSTEYIVVEDPKMLKEITDVTVNFFSETVRKLRNPFSLLLTRILTLNKIKGVLKSVPLFEKIIFGHKKGRDPILWGAKSLVLFHAKKSTIFADVNANLALQNASLMVQSMGLGGFYTGYVVAIDKRTKRISKLVGLPEGNAIFAGLAIGHPKVRFKNWIERNEPRINWL